MTRCECAGIEFSEVARRMAREPLRVAELLEVTGCGRTCTACTPDLERFLVSLARAGGYHRPGGDVNPEQEAGG